MWLTLRWHDYWIFFLEAYEITLFAIYWFFQTLENWNEPVVGTALNTVQSGDQVRLE